VIEYPLIFLAGFAGSWHCVGMCGGFACALGSDPRGRATTAGRQLTYNLGRATTYCFIGGLVGFLAAGLCTSGPDAPPTSGAQRILAIASGLLMVFIGLQFLGWFPRFAGAPRIGFGGQVLARALRDLLRAPGPAAPLAFGVFNGFLPCPLVYAFAAQAAGSGGALPGLLVMLAFGLGTFPAMLLMGGLGGWLRRAQPASGDLGILSFRWRQRGVALAGAFIMLLGLITFARGVVPMGGHLHVL
jgi:sulfite exporter TauE/SafE